MAGNRQRLGRFVENPQGMATLRTGDAVMADLVRRAENIASYATATAGVPLDHEGIEGMRVDSQKTAKGSRASVRTGTRAAIEAEATGRVLSRVWQGAGRA